MLQWSIDGADEQATVAVREALIAAVRVSNVAPHRIASLERLLGELLDAQRDAGHAAIAIALERRRGSAAVHLYLQGSIPDCLLGSIAVPFSIERSAQGTHLCLRLIAPHEEPLRRFKRRLLDPRDPITRTVYEF